MVTHCRPSHLRTAFEHSVNCLTKRGGKKGKEKERKTKGGAAQSTDQAKGRRGQHKGAAGGARGRTYLGWAKAHGRFWTRSLASGLLARQAATTCGVWISPPTIRQKKPTNYIHSKSGAVLDASKKNFEIYLSILEHLRS